MADDRPLVEQILDAAIFAPIGAIVIASEQLPVLVEKGRTALESRVTVARMVGRIAVATARRRVGETMSSPGRGAPDLEGDGRDEQDGTPEGRERADGAAEAPGRRAGRGGPDAVPESGSLAIPGYDSLAASHVVQRLEGLAPDELESVRRYEQATRKRRTILGRIAQLQGDPDAGA